MPRAKGGFKSHRRKKKILDRAKGYYSSGSRLFKVAAETVDKALLHAYRDRKAKKRDFRSLWIIRINAGVRALGLTYSKFMLGLKRANIAMNRKALADMAYRDPTAFNELTQIAKKHLNE